LKKTRYISDCKVHFLERNLYLFRTSFFLFFFFIFVKRYLVTLLNSLGYCEYVPSSAITNIPFRYIELILIMFSVKRNQVLPIIVLS
jgi:hypothetical protein